ERGSDRRFGFALRKRRHLVLETFEVACDRRADDIRPRGEKLAELDIGRPEPRQRSGEAIFTAFRRRSLDQAGKRDGGLGRQWQRSRIDQGKDTLSRIRNRRAPDAAGDKAQKSQSPA